MTHPDDMQPKTVPKNPPPTLRHYLIEKCREEYATQEEWEDEEGVEEEWDQEAMNDHQEGEEECDPEENMENHPELEDGEELDPNYHWFGPSGCDAPKQPIAAPVLKPIRQVGPTKYVPLNMGGVKGNVKGKGKGKGKNKGKGKGYKGPYPYPLQRPMGHATPITNPAIVQNPLCRQQWKGGNTKGWIPPMPMQMPSRPPPMPNSYPTMPQVTGVNVGPAPLTTPHMVPQMIPFYGFTPCQMGPQQQPAGPSNMMAMHSHPQVDPRDNAGKIRRRRKRKETEKDDSTTSESSEAPTRKKKRTHTVWLNVGGQKIPAKYKA